jgi:hypothetical protein
VQGGGPSKNLLSRHPSGCPPDFDHFTEGQIMWGSFVEKGGWTTLPGSDTANSAVAQACATMLGYLK